MCQEAYTKVHLNQEAYEKLQEFGEVFGTPSQAVLKMYGFAKEALEGMDGVDGIEQIIEDVVEGIREERNGSQTESIAEPTQPIEPIEPTEPTQQPPVPMRTVVLGHARPPMPKPKATPDYDTDRAEYGESTKEETYHRYILETLYEMGGRGKRRQVLDTLKSKMLNQLSSVDLETAENAKLPRWEVQANWCRDRMSKAGLVTVGKRGSGDWGMWELTEKGIQEVERSNRTRQGVGV